MTEILTVTITDGGDHSVGIFPTCWTAQVPFLREHFESPEEYREEKKVFEKGLRDLYGDYCDGGLSFIWSDDPDYFND